MKLINLVIKNFGLFKEASIIPEQINCIIGKNLDSPKESGNAAGKTFLFKLAIIFLIYGEGCGKKLDRLIRFGTKKTTVTGEIEHEGKTYKIVRSVPNHLEVWVDGEKQDYNTATIAQNFLNSVFEDFTFFKKYCLIDDAGINLLDSLKDMRSITTLKQELMKFIDEQFTPIRESLLKQKNDRELYSVDKRPYSYSLSQKRLDILDKSLINLNQSIETYSKDIKNQQDIINQIKLDLNTKEEKINLINKQIVDNSETIQINEKEIEEFNNKITSYNRIAIVKIERIPYDTQIAEKDKEINTKEAELTKILSEKDTIIYDIKNKEITISQYNEQIKNYKETISELEYKIANVGNATIGIKCDECGAIITDDNKLTYQIEKKEEIKLKNEAINKLNVSLNETVVLLNGTNKKLEEIKNKINDIEKLLSSLRGNLRVLNTQKSEQENKIKKIEQEELKQKETIIKYNELIETYKKQNNELVAQNTQSEKEINNLKQEIPTYKEKLTTEEDCMNYYNSLYESTQKHISKLNERIMKFKEAFKFSEYKYNLSDVQLYTDSIKTLDSFSGFYISEWLTSLTFIINDLLKNINQSIELTDSKEFIKMKDNGQELYYSDLSSGQRTFLSAVFKLSILLQKGESNRIIIADDGMGSLDEINFKNFIEVCKNIPMQFFLVFQDIPIIEGVNYTNIERKNNESRII